MTEKSKKKVEMQISGMDCASALNIEKPLKNGEDIGKVQMNFGTKKATIEYDPEKVKLSINISLKHIT
jgi:Cu+-exporting ATPase